MAKRKRESNPKAESTQDYKCSKKAKLPTVTAPALERNNGEMSLQIVAGSYDGVLHGIVAVIKPFPSLPSSDETGTTPAAGEQSTQQNKEQHQSIDFADSFLFNAHTSAIRCVAVSPSSPATGSGSGHPKVFLASGSSDERINLYSLSAHPPSRGRAIEEDKYSALLLAAGAQRPVLENGRNRELGALLHHAGAVTRLAFPTRAKLLSAGEDGQIAVTRTRDWARLHDFRCPLPRIGAGGGRKRPSGDTAAQGQPLPGSGVADFAVHPSMKILLTASGGERTLRLWNLVTGKKARKLAFEEAALRAIGEVGRLGGRGEGRRVEWGKGGDGEDEFAVAFERDVLVFGMDCRVRCRVVGKATRTKVHEVRYLQVGDGEGDCLLVLSTEDGRVAFFATGMEYVAEAEGEADLPTAKFVAQVGGQDVGVAGRIKDFKILPVAGGYGKRAWLLVTGSSDGKIRVWKVGSEELVTQQRGEGARQAGKLLGVCETQNRITCLEAFVMIPRADGENKFEFDSEDWDDEDDDSN